MASLAILSGCSLRQRAVDTLAEVLGEGEIVYLSDEDPELVGAALPFNIKTIETLLETSPEHGGLLLAATKAIGLYTYGFVEPEISRLEETDFNASEATRRRAARLYQRAYRYGMRGLELRNPGLSSTISLSPEAAVQALEASQAPTAVWTAAALGGAIGVAKDDPEMTADIAVVGALLHRALELDEDFDRGTIHEFLITYEAARVGGSRERAQVHYDRALELGHGKQPSIWLSWAENVSLVEQNRGEFSELLDKTIAFDIRSHPDYLLVNTLAQRRARQLKARINELFLED